MLFHTKCVAEAVTVRSVERQVADSQFPLNLEHSKLKIWTSISQWRLGEFFVFTGGGLTKLIRFQIFHVQFWRKSHRIAWLQVPFLEVSHKMWFSQRERERERASRCTKSYFFSQEKWCKRFELIAAFHKFGLPPFLRTSHTICFWESHYSRFICAKGCFWLPCAFVRTPPIGTLLPFLHNTEQHRKTPEEGKGNFRQRLLLMKLWKTTALWTRNARIWGCKHRHRLPRVAERWDYLPIWKQNLCPPQFHIFLSCITIRRLQRGSNSNSTSLHLVNEWLKLALADAVYAQCPCMIRDQKDVCKYICRWSFIGLRDYYVDLFAIRVEDFHMFPPLKGTWSCSMCQKPW